MTWIRQTILAAKRGERAALVKLVLPVAVILVIAYQSLSASPTQSVAVSVGQKSQVLQGAPTTSIWIHIAGAVAHPGVYSMPAGSRVFQIVAAAGGFTRRANQASVNLARTLTDGEQILVGDTAQSFDDAPSTALISINSASAATLETLPGVGPTLAGRMVDWRNANHGFKVKTDLRKVAGVGDKLFAQIKDLVTL